jgi:hypothetical protein|tara:strand:+ start:28 stop:234 length:207 start_codon:yes stop_codon:yes gene_type:complete
MFTVGDIVVLVSSIDGSHIDGSPPALIIRKYSGYPKDFTNRKDPETVYDILFNGELESSISECWLKKI